MTVRGTSVRLRTDADIALFLGAGTARPNDYVVNDSGGDLTTPDGQTVPADTAVIIESLNPVAYHIGDAPTPVIPPTPAIQQATGGGIVPADNVAFATWISTDPPVGNYALNMSNSPLVGGSIMLPPNMAAVAVPTQQIGKTSQIVIANTATPADPVTVTGSNFVGPGMSLADFAAPHAAGDYMVNASGAPIGLSVGNLPADTAAIWTSPTTLVIADAPTPVTATPGPTVAPLNDLAPAGTGMAQVTAATSGTPQAGDWFELAAEYDCPGGQWCSGWYLRCWRVVPVRRHQLAPDCLRRLCLCGGDSIAKIRRAHGLW